MPDPLTCRRRIGSYSARCLHDKAAHHHYGRLVSDCSLCPCIMWQPGITQRMGHLIQLVKEGMSDAYARLITIIPTQKRGAGPGDSRPTEKPPRSRGIWRDPARHRHS